MFIGVLSWKPLAISQWSDKETEHCHFQDKRIGDRFRQILDAVGALPGESIPQVCQNWAETKAVYRFLSNERVNTEDILSGHFHETSKRIAASNGPVLVLHDTSEFIYKRKDPKPIGITRKVSAHVSLSFTHKYRDDHQRFQRNVAIRAKG